MARGIPASTPEEYLENAPADQGAALRVVRERIRSRVPQVVERIGYGIIVFRLGKRDLVALSAAAKHCSLHLMSPPAAAALAERIQEGRWSGATLQFRAEAPLSEATIGTILDHRLEEIGAG